MKRMDTRLDNNRICYFDAGNLEIAELPEHPHGGNSPEDVKKSEAVKSIYELDRSIRNRPQPGQEKPRSPAAETFRRLSPIMHVEEQDGNHIVREENPKGFEPLINAYKQGGLSAMKACLLVEMAPLLQDHRDDRAEISKIIEFKNAKMSPDTQPTQPATDAEASIAVDNLLEVAGAINGDKTSRGGSIASEKRSFFRNPFRRTAKLDTSSVQQNGALKNAYLRGGETALKTEFLMHALPKLKGQKSKDALGKVAKIIDYSSPAR